MMEGGGRGESGARDEFFSEAQELVDGLGRDLLMLDELLKKGQSDPELINDVFRGVHTLKGLSGLFGATRMAGLSHQLEDVLDDLRLGRIDMTTRVLDLLFQAESMYARILSAEKGEAAEPVHDVEQLLVALGQASGKRTGGNAGTVAQYDLDPGLLGVLTEYEEHRLRTNIQDGLGLFKIRVRFSLTASDTALDELKANARPLGEIITYLPTGAGADTDTIELEILMASRVLIGQLRGAIKGPGVVIEEVQRRSMASAAPLLAAPPPSVTDEPFAPPTAVSVPPGDSGGLRRSEPEVTPGPSLHSMAPLPPVQSAPARGTA